MNNQTNALEWHDEQLVYGIRIRAYFFDYEVVNKLTDFVNRQLPNFKRARPTLIFTENDRKNFVFGELIGQPDAVLTHGEGLISLEYKYKSGRLYDKERWTRQIDLSSVLQSIAGAMVVAGETGKPTAAMLRYHNVFYLLDPDQRVIDFLGAQVSAAKEYWTESRKVSISQLAGYCEARIKKEFGVVNEASSAAGIKAHEEMLRR